MTRIEKAIAEVRANVDRLMKLEGDLIRTRGGLDGLPGANALDVAIEGVGHVRGAVDQAEHELEIEGGLYLPETDLRAPLDVPELAPEPEVPVCPWCQAVEGTPHAWRCPRPSPRR